jgi:HAMP domain-containing protein
VTTAIANGDLGQKITVDVKGEILQIKNVINQMVDSLSTFAGEVTRVAKEVGTEGKLGGQAKVRAYGGHLERLDGQRQLHGGNLTTQVRNIAEVDHRGGERRLSQKITVEAQVARFCELKNTINTMVDQLNSFAPKSRAWRAKWAPKVKLGGQARCPMCAGTWKDLTDSVNRWPFEPHRPGA